MFGKEKEPAERFDTELFTIYDSKTQSYGNPSFAANKHDLMRQIVNMFKDPSQKQNMLFTNAEDYSIFKIGRYSKTTGRLVVEPVMEHVANMHDLRALAGPVGIEAT